MRTGLPLIHLAVFAAVVLPYFINLGTSSLWDSNESFYAETPREMLQTGNFLSPEFNFQPRVKKPPLTYWIVAFSYRLLGIREFSVRLPGALAAAGLMFFVYLTGRFLFSCRTALVSLVMTGTTMRIMLLARKLPIDMLLLFFLAGAGYFVIRGIARNSTRFWILAYAFSALGFLTKGPIAVLIPFGTSIAWAAWSRRLGFRQMRLIPGLVVFSALVLPWHLRVYLDSGWKYIAPFLVKENLGRLTGEAMGPSRGCFYYVGAYLGEFFPWSILSIAALLHLWRARDSIHPRRSLAWGFPLIWSLLVFVSFTISRNKQGYYIASIYPMMALVLAAVLDRDLTFMEGTAAGVWQKAWKPALITIAVLLLGGVIALPLLIRTAIPGMTAPMLYGPSIVLLLSAVALIWNVGKRRPANCIATLGIAWWILCLAVPALYLPAVEPLRPIRSLCAELKPLLSPDDEVGYYRTAVPSMVFYLRRPIFEEFDAEPMVRRFQSPGRVFCVMTESDHNFFVGNHNLTLYVLARRPQLVLRFRDLMDERSRQGLELLLVSNQPVSFGADADRREAP